MLTQHRFFWGRILDYEADLHAPYPEVLERLRDLLIKARPQHISLQGLPGSGKSSAIRCLAPASRMIYLDMNSLYRETTDGFYSAFADSLETALGWTAPGDTPWRRVLGALNTADLSGAPILIVLDHFDRFLQFGDKGIRQGILAQLLGIMNNSRHAALVYVSVLPLVCICNEIDHMSELPERCTNVYAQGLSRSNAKELLEKGLSKETSPSLSPSLVTDVLAMVGVNCSLLQMCGAALSNGACQAEEVIDAVRDNAQVMFGRVFDVYSPSEWKVLLRYKSDPREASHAELQVVERMRDALIYSLKERAFFSGVFETYLNQRLLQNGQDGQNVFVRRPSALGKPEHAVLMTAACSDPSVYEVDWSLVGDVWNLRPVYCVRPYSASGLSLRQFYLKIDNHNAIDREYRAVESVRLLGVVTPPVQVIRGPGGGSYRGLKTDVASVDPKSPFWTLKEYACQSGEVPSNLIETLGATYGALNGLYRSATRKTRILRGFYQLQDYLSSTLETAWNSLSDPFGSAILRKVMLPPPDSIQIFQTFLQSKESVLCSPIHGDLHSRNVIRDQRGNTQIIDFGRYQKEGHVLADCTRLELSLMFDYAQKHGPSSADALVLLQILVNRASVNTVLSGQTLSDGPLEQILMASRTAVSNNFPDVGPREYLVSLLGTLLVLMSFEKYFSPTYRWVASAFAHHLWAELTQNPRAT